MIPRATSATIAFDTLLFVATSSEKDGVNKVAKSLGIKPAQVTGAGGGKYLDLGTVGLRRVGVVKTKMGAFGTEGSTAKAIVCRAETRATSLIGLGMAFGADPGAQKLGDVLVSSCLLPYGSCTVRCAPEVSTAIDYSTVQSFNANQSLLTLFRNFASRHTGWSERYAYRGHAHR